MTTKTIRRPVPQAKRQDPPLTQRSESHRPLCVTCGSREHAEHPAQTELGRREEEARRIARAEGYPIIEASDDWTYFTLDDPLYSETEQRTIRTHFEWVRTRFEGFVS